MRNVSQVYMIDKLREIMVKRNIDACLFTGQDEHGAPYPAAYWRTLEICGFTGSNGLLLISKDASHLITDGRYFLQAERELKDGVTLVKATSDLSAALLPLLSDFGNLACDGRTIFYDLYAKIINRIEILDIDIYSEISKNRTPVIRNEIFAHAPEFAGETSEDKLRSLRMRMRERGVDFYIVSKLDDLAWLLNMRGSDTEYTPLFYGYAKVGYDDVVFAVDADELFTDIYDKSICEPTLNPSLHSDKNTLRICHDNVNMRLYKKLTERGLSIVCQNLIAPIKAIKSHIEITHIENSHRDDSRIVAEFIIWLKSQVSAGHIFYEHEIHDLLFAERKKSPFYVSPAFPTIAAYMENAAVLHYQAASGVSAPIKPYGFLLIDSGAQYKNGTTDITRTIAMGNLTEEMKRDYTYVLKAHIALFILTWRHGATGATLDAVSRMQIWEAGLDYRSGTGHGIGYFLCVHEYMSLSAKDTTVIEEGMVLTVEPGIYRKDKWGIRLENTAVVERAYENEAGVFLRLRPLSFCPFEDDAIVHEMLTDKERDWLARYNQDIIKTGFRAI